MYIYIHTYIHTGELEASYPILLIYTGVCTDSRRCTATYVSSYCYTCVLILLHMRPHPATYVSSSCCTCVRILRYMCPQECALIADVVAAARSTAASLVAAEDAAAAAALRSAADLLSAQAVEEQAAGSARLRAPCSALPAASWQRSLPALLAKEKAKDSPQQALLLPPPLLADLLLRDAFVQAAAALYETYVRVRKGAQFTCFTGTKVQMLKQRVRAGSMKLLSERTNSLCAVVC